MGKYSLIAIDKNGNKEQIKMRELDKNGKLLYKQKVNLATIDKNTTYFNTQEEMTNYLIKMHKINIVPCKYQIEYVLKGIKTLPLVYGNNKIIKYFANQADSYVPQKDAYYINLIDTILKKFEEPNFYRFMIDNKYLNDYLKDKIMQYVYNPENDQTSPKFIRNRIIEEASSYKIVRGLVIGTSIFDKYGYKPNNKNNYIQSKLTKEAIIDAEITDKYIDVIDSYNRGGHDEVFNLYSADDIYSMPETVLEQIKIKK